MKSLMQVYKSILSSDDLWIYKHAMCMAQETICVRDGARDCARVGARAYADTISTLMLVYC